MNKYKIIKKSIILWIISLFLFNFNFSFDVVAEITQTDSDGVWHDDLSYDSQSDAIEIGYNFTDCNLINNNVTLKEGSSTINYNYANTEKSSNINGWYHEVIRNNPSDGKLFIFTNPEIYISSKDSIEITETEKIKANDQNSFYSDSKSLMGEFYPDPIHHFRFKIDENINSIESLTIDWSFGRDYDDAANLEKIYMYIWTRDIPSLQRWTKVLDINYNKSIIENDQGVIKKTYIDNIGDIIHSEGYIDILIIGSSKEDTKTATLYSDYIGIDVELKKGYKIDGSVISPKIDLSVGSNKNFYGWERIIWDGTSYSKQYYIKIQVLNEDNNIINSLDGNSDGFTSKSIDLSSLGSDIKIIKLKALFHTEYIDYSPTLFSWTVLWQIKENSFYDSFSSEYRTGEKYGVEIESGTVKISKDLTDWPMFGKNAQNSRSYTSYLNKNLIDKKMWSNNTVGGGFRSPVIYNDLVYIPGSDNYIYAYNQIFSADKEQDHFLKSINKYNVFSSVAVSNDIVVAATCELNSKNNKICGLDSSSLTEIWNYSGGNDFICFISNPVIANNRVYITSCDGSFLYNAILGYPSFKSIVNSLKNFFKIPTLTNRLYVLDLLSGKLVWDTPQNLPACSYSTPAVYDGRIYVGCDNINEKSLICYDENTKDELWSQSVGLVGRCSPVVHNGKVFIIGRNQSSSSTEGDDYVYCFNATDGDFVWSKQIGDNTTISGNLLKYDINIDVNLILSSPISSPAVYKNSLFVMTSYGKLFSLDIDTGKLNWFFNDTGVAEILTNRSYFSASPVVVDDIVYIATEGKNIQINFFEGPVIEDRAQIIAIDANNGNELKRYPIYSNIWTPTVYLPKTHIYSSPVISDNLIYVSFTEIDPDPEEIKIQKYNRFTCIGEYKDRTKGTIISSPIHVQKSKWWNVFKANVTTTENNTVIFNILDSNKNVISGFSNFQDIEKNISSINDNVIYLEAELKIGNNNENLPALNYWEVTWLEEAKAPIFDEDSFEPGQEGWITSDLEECSISVRDQADNDVLSGLDCSSAKFLLEYIPKGSDTSTSEWFDAICEGQSGAQETRVRAIIKDLNVGTLKSISFSIKDLAGNNETSNVTEFKLDDDKPFSEIDNINDLNEEVYNIELTIEASGIDDKSGIRYVYLKYRQSDDKKNWTDWETYGDFNSPYIWYFGKKDGGSSDDYLDSKFYQLTTIAEDKAGNIEEYKDESEFIEFLFDKKDPILNDEDLAKVYNTVKIPSFNIIASDDYNLKSVEYRLGNETVWKKINKDNIDEKTFSEVWSLPEEIWKDMILGEEYIIYLRVTDHAGNTFETENFNSPIVIKNENLSKFFIDSSDFEKMQWDDRFQIKVNIPEEFDAGSVKLFYRYSENNKKWSDWEQYGESLTTGPYKWDFKAEEGNGYYEFYTEVTDTSAENVYISDVEKVEVAVFPISQSMLLLLVLIILLGISIGVLRKMKKTKIDQQT